MQIVMLQENIFIFFKIFRFIDDLISINGGNEFENHYNETYLLDKIIKRKMHHPQKWLFYTFIFTQIRVKLKHLHMIKRNPTVLTMWIFHVKVALFRQKWFFLTISVEKLWICRATSSVVQCIKSCKVFLHGMLKIGSDSLSVKQILIKMITGE